ncbi:hypothetical protein AGMMS50239_16120 [Bacteroidia bacterium]|nr:hypothetical protein AGMMS50239_16120 [Bacteroidia bacterium]
MKRIKVFISSVQSEFASERAALCDYIRGDALLGKFFQPFIFEELPAENCSAPQAFLAEAAACDIYVGLLGDLYGYENEAEISPTEQEYDAATQNKKHRLIFIKNRDAARHVSTRQDKETAFIAKVEKSVVRKTFSSYEDLRNADYQFRAFTFRQTSSMVFCYIGKQTFIYNSRYLPEKVTSYTNDGTKKVSEETFLYDTFGNVTTHSSKAFTSANTLTTSYEYANGIFLTKVTNPLSQATTSVYNASGRLESVKDHRNNTTTYQYDDMGRLIKKNYPDGTFSSVTLAWGGSPANSVYCVTEQTTGKPVVKTYHDAFNRELRSSISRYDGSEMHCNREYNSAGRLYRESMPFKGASASLWNTYGYDSYGRINSENKASGKTTTYVYSGRNVTVTENGIASTRYYDAQGNLTSVTDPAGTITYNLRPDGQPASVVAPGNVTTSFHYDMYGRRDTITDPSAGKRSIEYDAAGNIYREKDADGRTKTMYYDAYNRLSTRVLPEFTTNCSYNQDGLIALEASTNGTSTSYSYDNLMRLSIVEDNAPDSKWFRKAFSYAGSNVASVQYTSQSGTLGTETYTYESGHLSEIKFGSTSVWKLNEENSFGQPKSVATGPLTRTYGYNSYGVPNGRTAALSTGSTVQNHTYDFDMVKGNLNYRKDNTRNIQESFTYDGLNRLKTFAGKNMEYDIKGNIKEKSDVGANFLYNTPGKPYAISGVDVGNNTAIPLREQQVTYTSFERPASISENNYTATFTYNGGGDRVKMQLLNGSSNYLTRYYLGGNYEVDEGSSGAKERLYLGGDAYSAPAVYVRQNGTWSLHYILRDYLGSITHITNSSGSVVQELSYDAWGRLWNPTNQTACTPGNEPVLFLGRGYTGHEHLTQFGLINMNARLYDPAVGRFLSPDPYVQALGFSQSYNRYAYCLNNPLKYTDENGEFWNYVIGGVIGGVVNWATHGCKFNAKGLGYFGVGAVAGAIGVGVGSLVGGAVSSVGAIGGGITGSASGFASGFVGGAGNAWIEGANFGAGLSSGLTGGGYGALTGGIIGGISGGITAYKHGGNIFTGKGAIYESVLSASDVDMSNPVTVGEGMEYSNNYAAKFSKSYFRADDVVGVTNLYADGSMPSGYERVGDYVKNAQTGEYVGGLTKNLGTKWYGASKGSNVYIFKSAFTSKEKLFLTMGHEYIHAAFNFGGHLNINRQEAVAYKWNYNQATKWNFSASVYKNMMDYYAPFNKGFYPYNLNRIREGFMNLYKKPW